MLQDATGDPNRPFATLVVLAYNQEQYIRSALEAALSQDYSPLEIIVSDDCSTDLTWDIIRNIAAEYEGPHKVIARRSERNRGIAAHFSEICEMASGELLVAAAGDDVSYPYRVSSLVDVWVRSGKPDGALHSAARCITNDGLPTGESTRGSWSRRIAPTIEDFIDGDFSALIHGATAAYTARTFREFGEIIGKIEDVPMTFRSLVLGSVIYVDQILVDYRTSSGITARPLRRDSPGSTTWKVEAYLARLAAIRHDCDRRPDLLDATVLARIRSRLDVLELRLRTARQMTSPSLPRSVRGAFAYPVQGGLIARLRFVRGFFGLPIPLFVKRWEYKRRIQRSERGRTSPT